MHFYQGEHRFYCGVDLRASTIYVCILAHAEQGPPPEVSPSL